MGNIVLRPEERRVHKRIYIKTKVQPGIMYASEDQKKFTWYANNVSKNGIALTIVGEMLNELTFSIEMARKKINLELRWGMLDVKDNEYRYGFECMDAEHDLEAIFREQGIIR